MNRLRWTANLPRLATRAHGNLAVAVAAYHVVAFVSAAAVIWLTLGLDRWRIAPLVVLGGFTIASILTDIQSGTSKVRISGVVIGLMVAVALLGPGPAALLGAATMGVSWTRTRARGHVVRNNVVVFTWFPLAAGLFFHACRAASPGLGLHDMAYYLVVFVDLRARSGR